MLLGYCLGKLFRREVDPARRRKLLTTLGLFIILFFVFLRWANVYGDPSQWSTQKNSFFTFLSFINTSKYPPSLQYMCMTIGPALLILALFETIQNRFTRIITVYGRVPFLYYILHFYVLHTLCMILFLTRGHTFNEGLHPIGSPFNFVNAGEGYHLWQVYLIWICVVAFLYPICKWFSNYKLNHKNWWLSYLWNQSTVHRPCTVAKGLAVGDRFPMTQWPNDPMTQWPKWCNDDVIEYLWHAFSFWK